MYWFCLGGFWGKNCRLNYIYLRSAKSNACFVHLIVKNFTQLRWHVPVRYADYCTETRKNIFLSPICAISKQLILSLTSRVLKFYPLIPGSLTRYNKFKFNSNSKYLYCLLYIVYRALHTIKENRELIQLDWHTHKNTDTVMDTYQCKILLVWMMAWRLIDTKPSPNATVWYIHFPVINKLSYPSGLGHLDYYEFLII